jgi:hypothetical protein
MGRQNRKSPRQNGKSDLPSTVDIRQATPPCTEQLMFMIGTSQRQSRRFGHPGYAFGSNPPYGYPAGGAPRCSGSGWSPSMALTTTSRAVPLSSACLSIRSLHSATI